jgi:hypothetical protein
MALEVVWRFQGTYLQQCQQKSTLRWGEGKTRDLIGGVPSSKSRGSWNSLNDSVRLGLRVGHYTSGLDTRLYAVKKQLYNYSQAVDGKLYDLSHAAAFTVSTMSVEMGLQIDTQRFLSKMLSKILSETLSETLSNIM